MSNLYSFSKTLLVAAEWLQPLETTDNNFLIKSGNFDDPPASDSNRETAARIVREILDNTQTSHDISPSGELLRAIERYRHRRGGLLHTMAEQAGDRRRRPHPGDEPEGSPLFVLPPNPPAEPTPRERAASRTASIGARRGRSRLTTNDRTVERNRTFGESGVSNGLADLQHAGRQLEQASSTLRALLDDPVPNISSPTMEPAHQYPGAEADHNRRAKRMKLDNEKVDSGFRGFSYGRYGQVEAGKLKMEIASCDGGIFSEHGGNYAAENVLKNDSTVYCTKNNRCNLVLRHQGGTAFSLKELIIKAPHSGYTAP